MRTPVPALIAGDLRPPGNGCGSGSGSSGTCAPRTSPLPVSGLPATCRFGMGRQLALFPQPARRKPCHEIDALRASQELVRSHLLSKTEITSAPCLSLRHVLQTSRCRWPTYWAHRIPTSQVLCLRPLKMHVHGHLRRWLWFLPDRPRACETSHSLACTSGRQK